MSRQDPFQQHVRAMLSGLGEDPDREGLQKTPERSRRPCAS